MRTSDHGKEKRQSRNKKIPGSAQADFIAPWHPQRGAGPGAGGDLAVCVEILAWQQHAQPGATEQDPRVFDLPEHLH